MRLRLLSDGNPSGVAVVDSETMEEVENVTYFCLEGEPRGNVTLSVEVDVVEEDFDYPVDCSCDECDDQDEVNE